MFTSVNLANIRELMRLVNIHSTNSIFGFYLRSETEFVFIFSAFSACLVFYVKGFQVYFVKSNMRCNNILLEITRK